QQKCLGKMGEVVHQGRTVLFVSHNMSAVNRLCSFAYWLDSGKLRKTGRAGEVVRDYLLSHARGHGEGRWPQGTANPGESAFVFVAVQLVGMDGVSSRQFFCSEEIHIRLTFRVFSRLQGARVGFFVSSADGATILEAYDSDRCDAKLEREPGEYIVSAV